MDAERERMVTVQLEGRGISDPRVLGAMRDVPRHAFVPEPLRAHAYDDRPLPIGHGATISQPYVVALMLELARVEPGQRVLDVGTGSGYQAAVLAAMDAEVYGIERVEPLAREAARVLADLGYAVEVRAGDGFAGWPDEAPFDAIVVAAAPAEVPQVLADSLRVGGRLVLPVGDTLQQELVVLTRTPGGFDRRRYGGVSFVPMLEGQA